MEDDSRPCELCNTTVLTKCYDIHRRACERNQQKATNKSKINAESKDMIPCSECGQMVPFSMYAVHLEECVGRQLVKCQQCKLLYPTFLIDQHMNVCQTFNQEPQQYYNINGNKPPVPESYIDFDLEEDMIEEEHDQEMNHMIMNLARNAPTDDKPLTLLQINKISPVMAVRAEDCSICYMKVFPKTMVPKLPCPHLYHTKCITAWLQKNPNCPMCRKHVLSH